MLARPMTREPLLTRPFLLVFAAHFLHALAFNLYLHLPGFLAALGATEVAIGVIFGVTATTGIACRPALGRAMDTRGRRVVIVWGGLLHAAVCTLYLTVGGLGPWLYAVRLGHGLADAMLFSSLFAYAADIVPPARRIEGIAIFGVSGMLPISLGGLLGDFILAHGRYPHLFGVSAVCAAAALLLSLPLREPQRKVGEAPPRGIAAAFAQRDLLPVWFLGLSFATAIAAHFTFFKTFVLATSIGSVGLFFTSYSGAAIALRVIAGSVPERIGPKRALFPAMASMAIGLFLLSRASGSVEVGIAGVLCGLGHGFAFPIFVGMVVARSRPSERGAALSIFTALFDGGTLIGGPLFGLVVRAAGYSAMFAAAAGVVVVGATAFAIWDRASSGVGEPGAEA